MKVAKENVTVAMDAFTKKTSEIIRAQTNGTWNGKGDSFFYETMEAALKASFEIGDDAECWKTACKLYRFTLQNVVEQLRDEIDGATETRGRDTRLTEMVQECERALRA